ncbi:MAG: hypothetical protein V3V78_01160, partial [Candidatus Woesearchaeota archaeon]
MKEIIIPAKFTQVNKIDYPFVEQKLPYLLDENFEVNDLEDINKFLQEDDEIIDQYLNSKEYPGGCMGISKLVESQMKKKGLHALRIAGPVYMQVGYEENFPFEYVLSFSFGLGIAASETYH